MLKSAHFQYLQLNWLVVTATRWYLFQVMALLISASHCPQSAGITSWLPNKSTDRKLTCLQSRPVTQGKHSWCYEARFMAKETLNCWATEILNSFMHLAWKKLHYVASNSNMVVNAPLLKLSWHVSSIKFKMSKYVSNKSKMNVSYVLLVLFSVKYRS